MKKLFLTSLVVAMGLTASVWSQEESVDAVLRDFEPAGDYLLLVDGEEASDALFFRSARAGSAIAVVNSGLGFGVLLQPRLQSVETFEPSSFVSQEDGRRGLTAGAALVPQGKFARAKDQTVNFDLDGSEVELVDKPYLLGAHTFQDVLDYDAGYAYKAKNYTPSPSVIRRLRTKEDTKVRVFFGSWCPHCKKTIPLMAKVAQALEGSGFAVEFYGVPKSINEDKAARDSKIKGVPTAIVYQGDEEIGRIKAGAWRIPELALENTLKQNQ